MKTIIIVLVREVGVFMTVYSRQKTKNLENQLTKKVFCIKEYVFHKNDNFFDGCKFMQL